MLLAVERPVQLASGLCSDVFRTPDHGMPTENGFGIPLEYEVEKSVPLGKNDLDPIKPIGISESSNPKNREA